MKRIILSDSEEEQGEDTEADQPAHEEETLHEDGDEPSPLLPTPQASPVPSVLPRIPAVLEESAHPAVIPSVRASISVVPLDFESSEEEEDDEFGRTKPKANKKSG